MKRFALVGKYGNIRYDFTSLIPLVSALELRLDSTPILNIDKILRTESFIAKKVISTCCRS